MRTAARGPGASGSLRIVPTESAETAARTLSEKTGVGEVYLERLRSLHRSAPRFARLDSKHCVRRPGSPSTVPLSRSDARWVNIDPEPPLAFDHNQILTAARDRVAGKFWWSNVAVGILPGPFTIAEAQRVYQALSGASYHPSTFGRDLRRTGLIVQDTAAGLQRTKGRPAAKYRFRSHELIWGEGRRKRVA